MDEAARRDDLGDANLLLTIRQKQVENFAGLVSSQDLLNTTSGYFVLLGDVLCCSPPCTASMIARSRSGLVLSVISCMIDPFLGSV